MPQSAAVFERVPFYDPQGMALDLFRKRYVLQPEETFLEAGTRTATHVAAAEAGELISFYKHQFEEILHRDLFSPGGRITYGAGRPKGQLMNCFVAPTSDSREGWGKTASDTIIICGTGGGLGINFSPIRPRGSTINGSGGVATGATSLMAIVDAEGEVIKAGGGRRTALMFALNLSHPDVLEFLDKKLDLNCLNNANVSVIFSDDPEVFFKKVRKDEEFDLVFRGKVVGKASAKAIWDKIVSNALKGGEPGMLNGYLANRMSNIWYYKPVICTNPCGEIWLCEYDACCLGSLVLPRFVIDGKIDYELMGAVVDLAIRFLDDVITVNNYPLPEIKEMVSNIRRIGLGVTGLHDMLLLLGLRYNSDKGLETVDHLMNFIKIRAYQASVALAQEKGSFPKFEAAPFLKSGFAKTLPPSLRSQIRERGIRNCALLTIPPVGTRSWVSGVTSGIEPMFAPAYRRKYRDGDVLREEIVVHPLLRKFLDEKRSTKHFQGAMDLSLRDHFEMQRVCQKHLDNACSKTINLPQGTSAEELGDLYMEFFPELKGVTVYPDGSREDQPLSPMSLEEAIVHAKESTVSGQVEAKCSTGSCDL